MKTADVMQISRRHQLEFVKDLLYCAGKNQYTAPVAEIYRRKKHVA
jgi:hypothetical protein